MKKRTLSIQIALLSLAALLFLYPRNKQTVLPEVMLNASEQNRLLVIAPHCDDEVLGAFGLIQRTLEKRGIVKVIIVTNGDAFTAAAKKSVATVRPGPADYLRLGYLRQTESLAALKRLGVTQNNIVFLSYPDKGLPFLFSSNWDSNKPYLSPFTKVSYTPYTNSYSQNRSYTGLSMIKDLGKLVLNFKPSILVYPHPDDLHPDHWATYAFIKYILGSLSYQPEKELLYLVHYPDWPEPFGEYQDFPLNPPRTGMTTAANWSKLELTKIQLTQKEASIREYTSQIGLTKGLLFSFLRKNELYGEYPPKQLTQNRANAIFVPDFSKVTPGKFLSLVAVNNGKNLIIKGKINGKIVDEYTYHLDLIMFAIENLSERLIISFKNHQFKTEFRGSGAKSSLPGNEIRVYFNHENNSIVEEIPLKNNRSFLLGAYIYNKNKLIDKMSWLTSDL